MNHELLYRAATCGLSEFGVADNSDPYCYCSCGRWIKMRSPRSGVSFFKRASRLHRKHVARVLG